MKIVCISDIHGKLDQVQMPPGDVLVVAGDLTMSGTIPQISKFNYDLGKIKKLYHKVIVIAGNHDGLFQDDPNLARSLIPNVDFYLNDDGCKIDGIKFWGSAWTPFFYDWWFNAHRGEEIRRHWDLIPNDTDVLITHGPPFKILDEPPGGDNVGCEDLLDKVLKTKPKACIFGHIHNSYGIKNFNDTIFVNASTCNEKYLPINPPIIIEI